MRKEAPLHENTQYINTFYSARGKNRSKKTHWDKEANELSLPTISCLPDQLAYRYVVQPS